MSSNIPHDAEEDDLSSYQVHSRREIINLLRNVSASNQLVRLQINSGADAMVTSILDVDETAGTVTIDCAPSRLLNERILESDDIAFETVLDSIRILFHASRIASCDYEDRPALCMAIPQSLIRLQRREFYRVPTPLTSPIRCTIRIAGEANATPTTITVPLHNVSGGGIAVIDEKKLLNPEIGHLYEDCRIDLPGGPVTVTLQVRNTQDLTLNNGKKIRRLGLMFVSPSNAAVAAMQRYITKLERDRNARATGMG